MAISKTHAVTAFWETERQSLSSTHLAKTPSPLQEQLAKVFKLPLNRVRVIVPPVGGGYGGKNHARIEPVVALLARKARRPVQWTLTREEAFSHRASLRRDGENEDRLQTGRPSDRP